MQFQVFRQARVLERGLNSEPEEVLAGKCAGLRKGRVVIMLGLVRRLAPPWSKHERPLVLRHRSHCSQLVSGQFINTPTARAFLKLKCLEKCCLLGKRLPSSSDFSWSLASLTQTKFDEMTTTIFIKFWASVGCST